MQTVSLEVLETSGQVVGKITIRHQEDILISIFHSQKQGLALLEECDLSPENKHCFKEMLTEGKYMTDPLPRFDFPPLISQWLAEIFEIWPGHSKYVGVAPSRICALVTFGESCGLFCAYLGGPCEVVVFYSKEDGRKVLDRYAEAVEASNTFSPVPIEDLFECLPEKSLFSIDTLTGAGAVHICAAIEGAQLKNPNMIPGLIK